MSPVTTLSKPARGEIRKALDVLFQNNNKITSKQACTELQALGIKAAAKTVENRLVSLRKGNRENLKSKESGLAIKRDQIQVVPVNMFPADSPAPAPQQPAFEPRGKRVLWTDEEKAAITNKIVELLLQNPTDGCQHCFEKAQVEILRTDRRRNCHIANIDWLPAALAARSQHVAQRALLADELETTVADLEAARRTADEEATLLLSMAKEEAIKGITVPELLMTLVARFQQQQSRTDSLLEAVMQQIATMQPTSKNGTLAAAPIVPTKRKFRIMVVGMLPNQVEPIKKMVGLDEEVFEYIPIDVNHQGVKLPHADIVVVWTKFCNHSMEKKAFDHFPKERVIRTDTKMGLSGIAELIKQRAEFAKVLLKN